MLTHTACWCRTRKLVELTRVLIFAWRACYCACSLLSQLFNEISARPETAFQVNVTYMEIYNDAIFDLLGPDSDIGNTDFPIVEDRAGGRGVIVKGLTEVEIHSEEEALNVMFEVLTMWRGSRKHMRSCSVYCSVLLRVKCGAPQRSIC